MFNTTTGDQVGVSVLSLAISCGKEIADRVEGKMYNRARANFAEERRKLLDPTTTEEGALSCIHNMMRLWNNPPEEGGRKAVCDNDAISDLLRRVASNTEEMPSVRREALLVFAKHFIPKRGAEENNDLIRFLAEHWDFLDNHGQGAENVKAYAERCWRDVKDLLVSKRTKSGGSLMQYLASVTNLMVAAGSWRLLLHDGAYGAIPAMHLLLRKHHARVATPEDWGGRC